MLALLAGETACGARVRAVEGWLTLTARLALRVAYARRVLSERVADLVLATAP